MPCSLFHAHRLLRQLLFAPDFAITQFIAPNHIPEQSARSTSPVITYIRKMDNIDTEKHILCTTRQADSVNKKTQPHEPSGSQMALSSSQAQERLPTNDDATTAISKPEDEDTSERIEIVQSALAAHNNIPILPDVPKDSSQGGVKQSSEEKVGDHGLGGLGSVYQEREAPLFKDLCFRVSILCPFSLKC